MTDFRPSRFQVLPTIVKNLLIINCLLALLQFVLVKFNIDLSEHLALHYWKSPLYRPWQLVTHMFMHGSPQSVDLTIMHLFSNMFALWMFGSVLENLWGPKRFLTFYLICGLGAAVLHLGVLGYEMHSLETAINNYQANPTLDKFLIFIRAHDLNEYASVSQLRTFWENDPGCSNCSVESINQVSQFYNLHLNEATVGASGAVFGVLFAFGYLFPNTLLYLYFFVPVKAKYFIAFYALFELYAGFQNSAGDNVAHFAHIGGMLVAFIVLKIWNSKNRSQFY